MLSPEHGDLSDMRSLSATALILVLCAVVATFGCGPGDAPPEDRTGGVESSGEETAPVSVGRRREAVTVEEKLAAASDPRHDGWDTEILTEQVAPRLALLATAVSEVDAPSDADLEALLADGSEIDEMRPAPLPRVSAGGSLEVRRWSGSAPPLRHHGTAGALRAVEDLRDSLGSGERLAALKVVGVTVEDESFETRVRAQLAGVGDDGRVAQTATWRMRWTLPDGDAPPKLASLDTLDFEEIRLADEGTIFEDVTASALSHEPAYEAQVLPGINHWLPRVSLLAGMSIVGHHGLAVGDANGDGLDDLYTCDAAGLPNRLWIQRPDGTAREAAASAGIDWLDESSAALFVDLDNDGDQDLAVLTPRRLLVSRNDGTGSFELAGVVETGVHSPASLAAADADLDGDLDLYVCAYDGDPSNRGLPGPVPYHDARNGGANVLLGNVGGLEFRDRTRESGLDVENSRFSFAAAWEDYDNDGDPDLYVANDFGRNNLYRNEGGRFVDVAGEAGVEDIASGMGVVWGDYNGDGWMDVYVSNMFSSAGNRVTYQRRFVEEMSERAADFQRMARGNTLFRNQGGRFIDTSVEAGVTLGLWAWASRFADIDNDSRPDLLVTNGYVSNDDSGDL